MSSKEEAQARVGTTLEQKWRLDALIGYSSIAATYRARHRNGLEAAIKIIHRSHCEFESVVERFLEEAHLANRVDHPGVERVFDDGVTDDGCVFLVMELLEGETLELRRMSMGGRLRLGEARPIVDGLLDALVAVHAANVLHRNLKPGNVFLTNDGRVVLTDFGRARLAGEAPRSALPTDELVIGSPAFMAPEQALVAPGPHSLRAPGNRPEVDARADIWSAGAIVFTLLTGRRVHEGATPQEKLENARTKPAPPLASILAGVNQKVAEVVDRALAFDKEERWPSASEMRRAWWLATGRDEASLPPESAPGVRAPMPRPPTPPGGWQTVAWPDEAPPPRVSKPASAPPAAPERVPPPVVGPPSGPLPDLGPPPLDAFVERPPPTDGERRRARTIVIATALVLVALGLAILAFAWSR